MNIAPKAAAAPPAQRAPAGSLAAWIVILAGVSAALHVGKLPPAIPALQADLGLTLVQAGFLLSLVQLGSMALGLVAGLMADGIGLKRCMVAGLWVLVLAVLRPVPTIQWRACSLPSFVWLVRLGEVVPDRCQ